MSGRIYMKFGDIKGDVTSTTHLNWVELGTCEFHSRRQVSHEPGSPRRNVGTAALSSVLITRNMSLASQQLFAEAVSGNGSKCQIHFVKGGKSLGAFMEYTLENAMIAHYSMRYARDSEEPLEHLEISFTSLQSVYTPTDISGKKGSPRSSGYDISQAKKL